MPAGSFSMRKYVSCDKHGRWPWEGHITCTKCGAVYSTQDDRLPTHIHGDDCTTCGSRLMPRPEPEVPSRPPPLPLPERGAVVRMLRAAVRLASTQRWLPAGVLARLPLAPPRAAPRPLVRDFTARMICPECFHARAPAGRGVA